jgi:arsenite methyltransferase
MVPIPKILWHEAIGPAGAPRRPEPEAMEDPAQVRAYVDAYRRGGPTSALQLHHLRELARLLRPGDTVVDLACGPGPLILDLAPLYPDVTFIGADLSPVMLDSLRAEAASRRLGNVRVLEEDIRELPSLAGTRVDLVISTSALHHLPNDDDLARVFATIATLLAGKGGFYLFDFALLRSARSRALFVADVAKLAPALTARDYAMSLDAAFPLDTARTLARAHLPRPFKIATSAFMDFCYFLQTPPRAAPDAAVEAELEARWNELSPAMKFEHLALRWFRHTSEVRPS